MYVLRADRSALDNSNRHAEEDRKKTTGPQAYSKNHRPLRNVGRNSLSWGRAHPLVIQHQVLSLVLFLRKKKKKQLTRGAFKVLDFNKIELSS